MPARIRYYKDSWWKVEDKDVWYLAGRDPENPDCRAGKWYFTNEAQMFSDGYATRNEAELALEEYTKHL